MRKQQRSTSPSRRRFERVAAAGWLQCLKNNDSACAKHDDIASDSLRDEAALQPCVKVHWSHALIINPLILHTYVYQSYDLAQRSMAAVAISCYRSIHCDTVFDEMFIGICYEMRCSKC